MSNSHNVSFFTKSTGLIINSGSKSDDVLWVRCIKDTGKKDNKGNGIWEKPSQGEGKVFSLSLKEQLQLLRVLENKMPKFSGFHSYKKGDTEIKTQFSFAWAKNKDNTGDIVWVNVDAYAIPLNGVDVELMRRLLDHIITEKIEFSTVPKEKDEGK